MIKSNWGDSTEIRRAAVTTRDYRFEVDIHMGDGRVEPSKARGLVGYHWK